VSKFDETGEHSGLNTEMTDKAERLVFRRIDTFSWFLYVIEKIVPAICRLFHKNIATRSLLA